MTKCPVCFTKLRESNLKRHMRRRHREERPLIRKSDRPWASYSNLLMSGWWAEAQVIWECTNLELRENSGDFEDDMEDLKLYAPAMAYAFLEVENFEKARFFYKKHLSLENERTDGEDFITVIDALEDIHDNGVGDMDLEEITVMLSIAKELKPPATAIRLLEAASALEPGVRKWDLQRIEALLASGRNREALELAELFRETDGNTADGYIGAAYLGLGRIDEGVRLLE